MFRRFLLIVICVLTILPAVIAHGVTTSSLEASTSVSQTSVIYVPGNYSTIQAAVNAASPGDTISVASGVYYENVVVNKTLKILGENSTNTIVWGVAANFTFTPTIEVTADSVEISGLTARNGFSGVYLNGSSYCNIHGNMLTGTTWGGGAGLYQANNNTIADNIVVNNGISGDLGGGLGVHLQYSNSNIVSYNVFKKNIVSDILVSNSDSNEILNNTIENSSGIGLESSTRNMVKGNNLRNAGGMGLGYSSNNTIENNWIEDSFVGITLQYSSVMNIIRGNTILRASDAGIGIADDFSHVGKNLVVENTVRDSKFGIDISFSNYSTFYHNNLINNTNNHPPIPPEEQAKFIDINFWNDSFGEGNYWSNYTGTDADGDGIGDTPHTLYALNVDYYPLMKPFIPGDANHDGIVNIRDGALIGLSWQKTQGTNGYNPHADLNMDGVISMADADIIRKNWQKHA